jgi:DNA-binding NarL/FixJ family response regulator
MKRPSLVLADDDEPVLDVIRRIVKPYFEVLATAKDGATLCDVVATFNPSVVVLDVSMPIMSGIQAARQLKNNGYNGKLVFLTVYRDRSLLEDGLAAGASGYVLKDFADTELVAAIREALAGGVFLSSGLKFHSKTVE